METVTPPAADPAALVQAARRRARDLLRQGAPLAAVLTQLASAVEVASGHTTVASILLLDRDGLLRNGASPNLPADYLDAIDRLRPDPNVGTCAAAAALGEIVETPSFFDDARWPELRHLPMGLGFLGAWSCPLKAADGRVLGTFGTYFRECRHPTAQERDTVRQLAEVAVEAVLARQVGVD